LRLGKNAAHKVGAIAERFLQGHLPAPFGDFGVVAADEDFRDFPAAEVSRTGVMGKIEHGLAVREGLVKGGGRGVLRALEQAEGFVLRRGFVAEGAGKQASDGVDDQSGGKFATGENEIADGDFFGSEMIGNSFVDAFVAAAEEENAVESGVAASGFLRETFAGGGEQDDGGAGVEGGFGGGVADGMTEERFDGFEERLGFEHHALAAAKGAIVDSAMTVFGEFAQVLDVDVDDGGFAGAADDAVLQGAGKEFGEDGDEVKAHWRKV